MPTVLRRDGFRFYFFSHEPHEPPHIHVDRGGATAKVWLDPVRLAGQRGFHQREINAILAMTAEHRVMFREAWDEHFGQDR